MLHYECLRPPVLELLTRLFKQDFLDQFYLVGGTALSLQTGHRISEDLDFFSNEIFDPDELSTNLKITGDCKVIGKSGNTLNMIINDVKVDLIRHDYPLVRPLIEEDRIRFFSKQDIGAAKLNSIINRGVKKDFYDLFFLLKDYPLNELVRYFGVKYGNEMEFAVLKSLTYFEDAESEPDPVMLIEVSWDEVKNHIRELIRSKF